MNTYNKTLTFITVAYVAILVCALFGVFSINNLNIALATLSIPLLILWINSNKLMHKTILLYKKINELQKALHASNEQAIRMKCESESLTKDNDNLSKKLISKHMLAHTTEHQVSSIITSHVVFNDYINRSISSSKRKNKIFALIIVTVDKAGIHLVQTAISNILRSDDIIAQFNDEIVILLNDIGKSKFASIVAEKILGIVKKENELNTTAEPLSVNMGICAYPDDGGSIETLFENASNALYKSIHLGPNNYEFHSDKLNIEAKEYVQLESALKVAIRNHEVSLYYQPKLELKSARIAGVEALMRWHHPVLGIINPDKFITISEETGTFMKIAETALMDACVMNKSWQNDGLEHITVSVNISPKQFAHPDLPGLINKATYATGLNPAYLELEISESTIMGDVESAEEILEKLKRTGVKLSIDHFGTGFTSISFLKRYPINTIKIDKSFIAGIPNRPNDMSITNAFIALAHNLGIEVVAEGVETAEQVQYLNSQHCDLIQGYFLSHPVHSTKISSQLKRLSEEVEI